jgi:hypothetical protein
MRTSPRDDVCHAAGTRPHALEHWSAVDSGVRHHEAADVWRSLVFGVAKRAFDQLLEHPRAAMRLVLQNRQRIVDSFAAN